MSKILKFQDRETWMLGRRGKVSGTRLKEAVSTAGVSKDALVNFLAASEIEFKKSDTIAKLSELLSPDQLKALRVSALVDAEKKKGFWKLVAERIALPADDDESPMDRGTRLEDDAIERFTKETDIKVNTDLVIFAREDNPSIAISPDGYIEPTKGKKITEMTEVKCLGSESHVEAYYTKKIPSDFHYQKLQYFIVNDDLKKLHWIFYDPRYPENLQFFVIEVLRKEVQEEVELLLAYQNQMLSEVDQIVNELTF